MTSFPFGEALLGSPGTIREKVGGLLSILLLLFFVAVGVDTVIHPRCHMNAYLRRGGEMLRELNEVGVQLAGVLLFCVAGWALYSIAPSVWLDWTR